MITACWQGVSLENPGIDSFFSRSQQLIDTLGKNNDPDRNSVLYGTWNMDSVRHALQTQHDSARATQMKRVTLTSFCFRADKTAVLSFDGKATLDTARWSFDDEGTLVLEDVSQGGNHSAKKMGVLQLADTVLQLMIWGTDDSSKITFRKVVE